MIGFSVTALKMRILKAITMKMKHAPRVIAYFAYFLSPNNTYLFSQHFKKQKLRKSQNLEMIQGSYYVLNTIIITSNRIQMCTCMICHPLNQEK